MNNLQSKRDGLLRPLFKTTCLILLVTFTLTVIACEGRPTLDFSSDEATVISIKAISEKLSLNDQQRFETAMRKIITNITNEAFAKSANLTEAYPTIKTQIYEAMNGKTAEEIIAMGERI